MEGVISILPEPFYTQVANLKAELRTRFDVDETTPPHFSYHVAPVYDLAKIQVHLEKLAKTLSPFTIRTSGIGIFTGESLVVYVTVTRNEIIEQVHRRVWEDIYVPDSMPYYTAAQWIPHITLADKKIDANKTAEIIRWLAPQSFTWDILIQNIVFYRSAQELFSFALEG